MPRAIRRQRATELAPETRAFVSEAVVEVERALDVAAAYANGREAFDDIVPPELEPVSRFREPSARLQESGPLPTRTDSAAACSRCENALPG